MTDGSRSTDDGKRKGAVKMGTMAMEVDAVHEVAPLDVCLNIWARWNALGDYQITSGEGNQQDTKEFMQAGEAIEVMINSLSRIQWWAIRKSKGICTVWMFQNVHFTDALAEAEAVLEPKLRKHVATRRHFN